MQRAGSQRIPPFCPDPDCESHGNPGPWRFVKKGFFLCQRRPRRVQRYRCSHCGRYFSTQTFSSTYWLKRPELLRPLFFRTLACSAYRQIAREFGLAHSTVQRQVERLGRHCLLLHESLRPRGVPAEPLVLDGFRTLESGHYWPFDLNLLVGADTHFVYGFQAAELRRAGVMRPGQRRHRERLERRHGRPDPQATRKSVEELVARVIPPDTEVEIRSDEHPAYPQAFRRLHGRRRVVHHTTSSRAARTSRNPLFAVNLADLLLRHCGANHKRETIAFSKRRQGALYRVAIFAVWRNYMKPLSERRRDAPPGVRLGRLEAPLRVEEILGRRLFPWRAPPNGWLARCYFGQIPTRSLPRCREHRLRYAV
jgi:transposase-like protein